MKPARVYQVGQVNRYIKGMFQGDMLLSSLHVSGEVSNCKYHSSGHIYFSIKDAGGSLSCIMFASDRRNLAFQMKDGDKVVVGGRIDVYERGGSYQLYAKEIRLEGEGALYEQFLRLKNRLSEMGMFDALYKQPIPRYATKIGVVTAPTGAAIRDIQNISHRRNPYVKITLYPALVQGEGAAASIVRGIEALDLLDLDVIIVGRGGGSIEDLWAFNEEIVANAIFEASTPIISAVGHETDTTIADFVADLRAPTPSAAAEIAVFDYGAFQETLGNYRYTLTDRMKRKLEILQSRHKYLRVYLEGLSPANRLNNEKKRAADLAFALDRGMEEKLRQKKLDAASYDVIHRLMQDKLREVRHREHLMIERMKGLNPLDMLERGFSYTSDEQEHAVTSVKQVKPGDQLTLHVTDGQVVTEVKKVHPQEESG